MGKSKIFLIRSRLLVSAILELLMHVYILLCFNVDVEVVEVVEYIGMRIYIFTIGKAKVLLRNGGTGAKPLCRP